MPPILEITPLAAPIHGTIRPPGSKSLTNRALIVAALAKGTSRLSGALDSQDTRVMIDSLCRLGLEVVHDSNRAEISIAGAGDRAFSPSADLWLENSGTSIRFLTALCTLGSGRYRLDGNARMRERPIGDLIDALCQLGADVHSELENNCPPVTVVASGLSGGRALVRGNISSQFLSALLMAAPCAKGPIEIAVADQLVSEPYVEMTLAVMRAFGVGVDAATPGRYLVKPQPYQAREYAIEPDASAASYFFAAAAITQGEVTVEGLSRDALQGDVAFADALAQMGCDVTFGPRGITVRGRALAGIDIDMNAISDTAQTLSVVAPFASGKTRIRNVAHMRHKETDRIAAVAAELRKLGQQVEEHPDGLTIHPAPIRPATIATYDDHRMAMSFALVGLRAAGICIENPECTAKTYPHYFDDLARLGKPGDSPP